MTQAAGRRGLLRIAANARRLASTSSSGARETVLILCSGSGNNFNYEDFYGAGVRNHFSELMKNVDLSGRRRARARTLPLRSPARRAARVPGGAMMVKRGLRREVEYACRVAACRSLPPGRRTGAARQ